MKLSFILAVWLIIGAPLRLQANGYIGVFLDWNGTDSCIQLRPFEPATVYVIARLGGDSEGGITAAEFRLELSSNSEWLIISPFLQGPNVTSVNGNPIDRIPCDSEPAGANIGFAQCDGSQTTLVHLGTFTMVQLGSIPPFEIRTKRRQPSTNEAMECPSFALCDAPNYTRICLTPPEGDPILRGFEPTNYVSLVNPPFCEVGFWPNCPPVAIQNRAWAGVKGLYR